MLTELQLAKAVGCTPERAAFWLRPITIAMSRYGITTRARVAAFLAQVGHESAGLSRIEENLRYTASRLLAVFPQYFDADQAKAYANKPEAIAARVYANRNGNGPEASGDGWRYRGRGLIQITGSANYAEQAVFLGLPLMAEPERLLQPGPAALSAAAYWQSRSLNGLADAGQFATITRRINGGLNGQPDRLRRLQLATAAIA